MIESIVKKYPAVFVLTFLIIISGMRSYMQLPRENFPEIRRPVIFVTTVYPGISAADIETLVTREIENEIDGVQGLDDLTSVSSEGVSSVTVEFTSDTNVEAALRRVRERVDIAKSTLPADAQEPVVRELNFSDMPIMIMALSNPAGTEILEKTANDLEDELKKIPGIQEVTVSGKPVKEVSVEIEPGLLKHYELSLSDISKAIGNENISIPGGTLKSQQKNFSLNVSGEIKDPSAFEEITVIKGKKRVRLKDLGVTHFTYAESDTYTRVNGVPSISIAIKKRGGENILRVSDDVKSVVDRMKKDFPSMTKISYVFDSSKEVLEKVYDLENNILTGLLFVILITLFFLGPLNATFVSLGIPFSMLISFFVLQILGITLNMVVLFSLILALGMLVDNGIVIVENIYRHRGLGKDRVQAAIDGAREVAIPITTSTITTLLAFFPIVFMPGIMGEFMQYLPKTVIIVLTASLVVALSITTVFCARFLKMDQESIRAMQEGKGSFIRFTEFYERILKRSLKSPFLVLFISFLLVFSGILVQALAGKGTVFFPKTDPSASTVSVKLMAGAPVEETNRISHHVEDILLKAGNPVEYVQTSVGQGANRGMGADSREASIRIGFYPFQQREQASRTVIHNMNIELRKIPGAEIKIKAAEEGPPSGHDVSFEITGDDYTKMGTFSEKIYAILETYTESWDQFESDFEAIKPEIKIAIDRSKAAFYGLDTRLIASTIRTAIAGQKISTFRQGKEEYDVVLRLSKSARKRLEALRDLEIVSEGKRISLASVANINHSSSVPVIKRRDQQRAVSVWADFRAGIEKKEKIKEEILSKVAALEVPSGLSLGAGKGQDVRDESTQFLIQAFEAALLLIFMVLVLQFNSVTQPVIILISVFLSLGGVLWGIFLSGQEFVIIMSGIGIISLAGVVVNNAIVLLDFINRLVKEGVPLPDAIISAGKTRLRPVVLTALTTVIGLIPMAFGISFDFHHISFQSESESSAFWSPMAWTVIFGLSFATVLTLVVVPVLVMIDHRFKAWIRDRRSSGKDQAAA
ncbi:MAG: efflux RND transporter permease subunit [Deltaproteobacteria bacterium]|nr:efflux RND transporter permease subunit [Deltaproteobacteria bacterium]